MPTLKLSREEPDEKAQHQAIAIVRGDGPENGAVLTVSEDHEPTRRAEGAELLEGLPEKDRAHALSTIKEAIEAGIDVSRVPARLRPLFLAQSGKAKDIYADEISLPIGASFRLLPPANPAARQVIWAWGSSGCGKTTVAAQYCRAYLALFPKRRVYIISALSEDPTLDKLGERVKRINVQSLVDRPIPAEDVVPTFKESIVLADDFDMLPGPQYKAVLALLEQIASLGRHSAASLYCCAHRGSDFSRTRLLLNEATHYLCYPSGSSYRINHYLLTHYCGLTNKEVQALSKINSRYVCLSVRYPRLAIAEHKAWLLK